MSYSIPSRIPIIIESLILIQNMSPSFNRIKSAWTQKSFLGKNLSQYSLIGMQSTMAWVALVYRELEWLKYWSYRPFLIAEDSRGLRSLLSSSKKFLPLYSDAWKDILHWAMMESQSCFLQKSQDNLHR